MASPTSSAVALGDPPAGADSFSEPTWVSHNLGVSQRMGCETFTVSQMRHPREQDHWAGYPGLRMMKTVRRLDHQTDDRPAIGRRRRPWACRRR